MEIDQNIVKNKLDNPFDYKDLEFYSFISHAGSDTAKAENMSMRVTKRFKWAFDMYKRAYGLVGKSDSATVEHLIWSFALLDNPIVNPSEGEIIKKGLLTKFFLESSEKDAEGNLKNVNFKYVSSIELSWSVFHIFRIIKLYIVDETLLKPNEVAIVDFIKRKNLFWVDDRPSFQDGILRTSISKQVFTNLGNNPDEFIDKLINQPVQKIESMIESRMHEIEFSNSEDSQIRRILEKDILDTQYVFRSHTAQFNEDFFIEMALEHFPVELERLKNLMKKRWDLPEINEIMKTLNGKKSD